MDVRRDHTRNSFSISEWSGAMGDLGTTLPLAFALAMFSGFPVERLFFLWGAVYLATGLFFRVPVSVQPLKAMAVIAISSSFTPAELSGAGVFFGVTMILLWATGAVRLLAAIFTKPLIRGIQVGLGAILVGKAFEMASSSGFFAGGEPAGTATIWAAAATLALLAIGQRILGKPASILLIPGALAAGIVLGPGTAATLPSGGIVSPLFPDPGFFPAALVLLIVPQLPLTLGNAVFASSDACRSFWPERSRRVSPSRFAASIGMADVLVGFLGGFPVCHGAGGVAAHARFGARTGGATMIIGTLFVLASIVPGASRFIFLVPIPVMAAMLASAGLELVSLLGTVERRSELAVVIVVSALSFATRNLAAAMAAGIVLERVYNLIAARLSYEGENP